MSTQWTVPRAWEGETVAILASGPSMTREQAELVRGKCHVIAVNNQGIDTECNGEMVPAFAPWADVLYAADQKWWHCYKDRALKFEGLKVTIRSGLPFKEVLSLHQSSQRVFDPRPTHLASGGNSGYQAVHLAVHFGVTQIWLCGFDMVSTDKRRHWFGNHPPRLNSRPNFSSWLMAFTKLAPILQQKGIRVFNCSPKSAIRSFPKADLRQLVKELDTNGIGRPATPRGLPEAHHAEGSCHG
jgi:hypothetical protein